MNRCVECGKFRAWEELHEALVPNLMGLEPEYELVCETCNKQGKDNELQHHEGRVH